MGWINYKGLETVRRVKDLKEGDAIWLDDRWRPIDSIITIDGVTTTELDGFIHKQWDPNTIVKGLVWIPTNDAA